MAGPAVPTSGPKLNRGAVGAGDRCDDRNKPLPQTDGAECGPHGAGPKAALSHGGRFAAEVTESGAVIPPAKAGKLRILLVKRQPAGEVGA